MHKRLLIPTFALLALCAVILAPVPESEAAGYLDASFSCEPGNPGQVLCYAHALTGVSHRWYASGKAHIAGSSTGGVVHVSCWGGGGYNLVTHKVTGPYGYTATSSRKVCTGGVLPASPF